MSLTSYRTPSFRSLVALLAAALLVFPLFATPAFPQQGPGSVDLITADQLRDYLFFIASDEMEGRRAPSRGLDLTAKFIALELSRWGAKPAGDDGGYLQMIELERSTVDAAASFFEVDGMRFGFGDGFLSGSTPGSGSARLLYAGDGWVVPQQGADPYQGLDVRGAVVVVTGATPAEMTREQMGAEGVQRPAQYLADHGALAMIVAPNARTLQRWERSVQMAGQRGATRVVGLDGGGGSRLLQLTASTSLIEALFAGTETDAAGVLAATEGDDPGVSFDLGKTVDFEIAVTTETLTTQNVVAIFEGTDPELKDEYVAIGAHYDHMGVGNPVDGDGIYNGADDDGSGTTAVLAIAEALAKGERPKRSVMLVWHTGEEAGMWGSRYINEKLPVPARNIVAALNIDMIGRSRPAGDTNPANANLTGPNEVYVIGPGVQSAAMGEILDQVNDNYLGLTFNPMYDAMDHPERIFFRSDHINYARNGIPIAFFFTGTHEDYHRPSDHPDKIDYDKMLNITRTIYAIAWDLASRPDRPALNADLPEELRGGGR
ncbi:MAG: M28 family peptidase [Acidobacteriota bacterium]|jgi:hypothetical protein